MSRKPQIILSSLDLDRIEALLAAGSYDLGPKAARIENPAEWTREKILERAKTLSRDKGPEGDFDD